MFHFIFLSDPPPVEIKAENVTPDSAKLTWIYPAACYNRIEILVRFILFIYKSIKLSISKLKPIIKNV